MVRLIESSLWVDLTRSKSPLALKTLIHPWILDAAYLALGPSPANMTASCWIDGRPPPRRAMRCVRVPQFFHCAAARHRVRMDG